MLGGCKIPPCASEAVKQQQARTNHRQLYRAMHTAGQAQQMYKPVAPVPFTSEMHVV